MRCIMICKLKDMRHFQEHLNKAFLRLPPQTSLLMSFHSPDDKQAWLIWECESIPHLKQYLNKFLTPFASYECHPINDTNLGIEKLKRAA